MAWLLDTNILSELRRLKPEPKVLAFIEEYPLDQLYISSVTIAELRFGIELLAESEHRPVLQRVEVPEKSVAVFVDRALSCR